jgi:proteasome lid subunit RPN8/RPN11
LSRILEFLVLSDEMAPPVSLKLEHTLYREIVAHLQDSYPLEACGLLAGAEDEITKSYPIENILKSPMAFEMDPKQQITAMIEIEAQGLDLLAIYHSHPHGPQTPSPTDVAMAYYPDSAHLIVSLQDREKPVVRAFSIADKAISEVLLRIK